MSKKLIKPFGYLGAKDHAWDYIADCYAKSGKTRFVDLFAGGLFTSVNIKHFHPTHHVTANAYDKNWTEMLNAGGGQIDSEAINATLDKLTKAIMGVDVLPSYTSGSIKEDNPELWDQWKANLVKLYGRRVCPVCGKTGHDPDAKTTLSPFEAAVFKIFLSFGLGGHSLSANFYSVQKKTNQGLYLHGMAAIDVLTSKPFDASLRFQNSFILLDPPYHSGLKQGVRVAVEHYADVVNEIWGRADDAELLDFITHNLANNNALLIYAGEGSNLAEILPPRLTALGYKYERTVKHMKKNSHGRPNTKREIAFLVHG